jgi:hypothetical protein
MQTTQQTDEIVRTSISLPKSLKDSFERSIGDDTMSYALRRLMREFLDGTACKNSKKTR